MVKKIAYDAGHGGCGSTPGKRTPDGEYEWNFNDKVADAFAKELATYEGVELKRFDDATGKTDVSLSARTNGANAWGADVFISFHHNANTGKWGSWGGVETHVYKSKPAGSDRLAKLIQPELVKAYGLKDRGIKYTDLHITRETKCDAVLVEGGFMDSTEDIKALRDDSKLQAAGKGVALAVANFLGLKKKPIPVVKPAVTKQEGVIAEDVWTHSKADFDAATRVKVLKKGEKVSVFGEAGDLYKIGTNLYVSKKYVIIIKTPVAKTGTVTGDVFTHNKPDFNVSTRDVVLKKGATVGVYGESNGMYKIRLAGKTLYVSKKYLTVK